MTEVRVKADNGRPVEVTPIDPITGKPLKDHQKSIVWVSTESVFVVCEEMDLRIREMKWEELHKPDTGKILRRRTRDGGQTWEAVWEDPQTEVLPRG